MITIESQPETRTEHQGKGPGPPLIGPISGQTGDGLLVDFFSPMSVDLWRW